MAIPGSPHATLDIRNLRFAYSSGADVLRIAALRIDPGEATKTGFPQKPSRSPHHKRSEACSHGDQ